tara:strand:- start:131 stop:613 length:483 start_codon:yes stop_codon:yes gene_type:complete
MSWREFREKGRIVERNFYKKHLTNAIESNDYQDFSEHWDVQGDLDGKTFKFDVKGLKKTNRWDSNTQDDAAWHEGTNVKGKPGWGRGKADYIVFERSDYWLVVNREELFKLVWDELKRRGFPKGKGIWLVYNRWDRPLERTTMVPYRDIEKLKDVRKLPK